MKSKICIIFALNISLILILSTFVTAASASQNKQTQQDNSFLKVWDAITQLKSKINDLTNSISEIQKLLKNSSAIPGPRGPTGPTGARGLKGARGEKGDTGPQGIPGIDGKNGIDGKDGIDGAVGPKGDKGDIGPQGIQGINGTNGRDGLNGSQGPIGPPGPTRDLTTLIVFQRIETTSIVEACCPEGYVRTGCNGGANVQDTIIPPTPIQNECCRNSGYQAYVYAICLKYAN